MIPTFSLSADWTCDLFLTNRIKQKVMGCHVHDHLILCKSLLRILELETLLDEVIGHVGEARMAKNTRQSLGPKGGLFPQVSKNLGPLVIQPQGNDSANN